MTYIDLVDSGVRLALEKPVDCSLRATVPWSHDKKQTTLVSGSMYPRVVVTVRLVYLRLAWPVPLCLHKLCKVVYKGLRDGLTFSPFLALLRIPSILSKLIVCIV